MEDGVRVWRQYITEIVEFFEEIDNESRLTISYRALLDSPEETAGAIGRFLGLSDWSPIQAFLRAQRLRPTLFSDPVTELSAAYRTRTVRHSNGRALALAGDNAERLGYVDSATVRSGAETD
jgi:hypothetical protein